MMEKAERIKKMTEFRVILEKRVREMEIELEGLRALLGFIDDILFEGGFKRVEIEPSLNQSEGISTSGIVESLPLKTITGDLLANLLIHEDVLRIVLDEGKEFNIHTPPFKSFFLERVLTQIQEKDKEALSKGDIPPDKMLSYRIESDGDLIREINIRNVTTDRQRELISAIRWTLEKMHEKALQNI